MSMAIGGKFAAVLCDSPVCLSVVKISPDAFEVAGSLALRARGQLIAEGWTKDKRGQDQCPDCTRQRAHLHSVR
jgi:hypothetical protein